MKSRATEQNGSNMKNYSQTEEYKEKPRIYKPIKKNKFYLLEEDRMLETWQRWNKLLFEDRSGMNARIHKLKKKIFF